jgi:hypothetical protein
VSPPEVFPHQIVVQWSQADGAYIARIEALNIIVKGDRPHSALMGALIEAGFAKQAKKPN